MARFDNGNGYDVSNSFDIYAGYDILRLGRVKKLIREEHYIPIRLLISEDNSLLRLLEPVWHSNDRDTLIAEKAIYNLIENIGLKKLNEVSEKVEWLNKFRISPDSIEHMEEKYEEYKNIEDPEVTIKKSIEEIVWEEVAWEEFQKTKYKDFVFVFGVERNPQKIALTSCLKKGVMSVDKKGAKRYHAPKMIDRLQSNINHSKLPFSKWEFKKEEIGEIKEWFNIHKLFELLGREVANEA